MATVTQKPSSTRRTVRFEFQAPAYTQRVALVGDFNAWNRSGQTMRRTPAGPWEITVELAPGRYQYKFLVNDNQWLADPKAQGSAPNQYGSTNSVIEVK